MATDLATLYEVQQVDTRIVELEREGEALDSGAELRAQAEVQRMQVQTAHGEVRQLEAELRDTELQIKARDAKKRDFESRMYGGRVRNPKELEDLQHEVEMLGSQVDKLEDKGLDLMEELERRRTALTQQEQSLKEMETRLREVEEHYQAQSARIAGEIGGLQERRAELTRTLPQDLLRRYDDLRAKRANLAIVKITSAACPGCRISVSLDTMRQLKAGGDIVTCESCGRILYREPTP